MAREGKKKVKRVKEIVQDDNKVSWSKRGTTFGCATEPETVRALKSLKVRD